PSLRKKLGLDPPRDIVRVEGHTLRIGGDDPSHGVYVARDDEPGAVVAEHRLVETADLDPRLWMSMRVTLRDPSEAKTISVGEWTLAHDHEWRVTRPDSGLANEAKVDALVQALTRARAVAEDPSRPPLVGGTVLAIDGEPQARIDGERVDRADGARLTFRKPDLNLVTAPPTLYYERRLFPLRLDDIVAVDVGPLKLRRESGVWRLVAPATPARTVDDAKVRAFLEPLLAAEATRFLVTKGEADTAAGGRKVRLATSDEQIVATIDGVLAERDNDAVTLVLPTSPQLATSF
ncbi:MAG TPA: DUF4340 domain-containing protein, partial [Polyangia bacterium]